jgi:endogenous inhibitor of DNA gyrase (YacG/DUF329 family)
MNTIRCPICGQTMELASTVDWPEFPFCSARCKTIDLGRWLGEKYRVVPEGAGDPPGEHAEERDIP